MISVSIAEATDTPAGFARRHSRDGVNAFLQVADHMSAIRSVQQTVLENLSAFAEIVCDTEQEQQNTALLASTIQELKLALGHVGASGDRQPAIAELSQAKSGLLSIMQTGILISVIKNLTKMAAVSITDEKQEAYQNGLAQAADDIAALTRRLLKRLDDIESAKAATEHACTSALSALTPAGDGIADSTFELRALAEKEAKIGARIKERSAELSSRGKALMDVFVTAMQFSDRLSQRLEHVGDMLELSPSAQVAQLAAEQVRSAAKDIANIAIEVDAAMREILDIATCGADIFSQGEIAEVIGHTLQRRTNMGEMITAQLQEVRDVVASTQKAQEVSSTAASDAATYFNELRDAMKRLSMASINSTILASRADRQVAALKVLSLNVRAAAKQNIEVQEHISEILQHVVEQSANAESGLMGACSGLENAFSQFALATQAGDNRLAQINALREASAASATSLLPMVEQVTQAILDVRDVGEQLVSLADAIASNHGEVPADQQTLDDIYATYTMQEERVVHRALFPAPEQDSDPADIATDCDNIEDLFF